MLSVATVVVLISCLAVGSIAVAQLATNIDTVALAGEGMPDEVIPDAPALGSFEGGFNLLVVGSDVCDVEGGCPDREAELNDVTMLVHVSDDHTSAVAVSIPRDLVVPIPACPMEDGSGSYPAISAQAINTTLGYGGLACTVLTVEQLTGLDIPYAGLITFSGVIHMSTAVGGVPVCIDGPIDDRYSGFRRDEAGEYTLAGQDALNFLRTRHGVGDGSDLGRISSQQVFLSSLVRTIKSDSTLTDITKLYGLAQAATSNMQLSSYLAPLNTMVSMALVLKDIPLERITFVQYPGTTEEGGVYAGKVAPITDQADALFARIAADDSFTLEGNTGVGSTLNPNAPVQASSAPSDAVDAPAPATPSATAAPSMPAAPSAPADAGAEVLTGVLGQTAADYTCSRAN